MESSPAPNWNGIVRNGAYADDLRNDRQVYILARIILQRLHLNSEKWQP